MILYLDKVKRYRLFYVLNFKKGNFVSFFSRKKMFLEQKILVTISCRFFNSHSIFVLAIFLRPYINEVSKKIANSKIE